MTLADLPPSGFLHHAMLHGQATGSAVCVACEAYWIMSVDTEKQALSEVPCPMCGRQAVLWAPFTDSERLAFLEGRLMPTCSTEEESLHRVIKVE